MYILLFKTINFVDLWAGREMSITLHTDFFE